MHKQLCRGKNSEKYTPSATLNTREWKPLIPVDILEFLTLLIMIGIDKCPDLNDFWSNSFEFYTPVYHTIMTLPEFLMIYSTMLHAAPPRSAGKEKIESFINLWIKKFQSVFILSKS
ncbi:hypothetical protein PoB_007580200 [Plakobranchus ocellatus]|uniref:PiggyBac transposable element-derived protein domain-containing protein n=1 Tax=Plakobranchus ocellatus TaxID=259542 RepID=A0AAV4DZ37_9GAST|nr:hypothetical protein PoB_007580200 [Plakobranchus ocellatus]